MLAPNSRHFTSDELRQLRRSDQPLPSVTEARLVYHLGALCPACWAAVRELPPLETEPKVSNVPVVLALRTLTRPRQAQLELHAWHRLRVLEAGQRHLGFSFLMLEELCELAGSRPLETVDHLRYCAGNGVLLLHVPDAHDLQASFYSRMSTGLSRANQLQEAEEALALAKFHADQGTGRDELRVDCLRAQAMLADAENRTDRVWAAYEDAAALLENQHPADCLAEILYGLGKAMLYYSPANRIQATGIFKRALAILDRLEPGTNPRLRLSLIHRLASALLAVVVEERTAGTETKVCATLREVQEHLRGTEELYRRYATPLMRAQRAGFLAQAWLVEDHQQAVAWLREALSGFCEHGEVDEALNLELRVVLFEAKMRRLDQAIDPPAPRCFNYWQFPQQRQFYVQVRKELAELLAQSGETNRPKGFPPVKDFLAALKVELEAITSLNGPPAADAANGVSSTEEQA
jgi:tetratricopeptide (TPR) repeat protein